MSQARRYIFHASASALTGRLLRPQDVIIDGGCASSLTVAGGRSHAEATRQAFGGFIAFGSAVTDAQGAFDDSSLATELTFGRVAEETLTTSTTAFVELKDLVVGQKPTLKVGLLLGSLISRSPGLSGEPSIRLVEGTAVGVFVDEFELRVTVDATPFQLYDTRAKLLAMMDDEQFLKEHGDSFLQTPSESANGRVQMLSSCGTIYANIVKRIEWVDDSFQGATIDRNSVTIPNIGRVVFGEIIISGHARRLTMLRLQLGSDVGGMVAAADVISNGDVTP
jgi:hypothetical protein